MRVNNKTIFRWKRPSWQEPEITIVEEECKIGRFLIKHYYSHRTHTASISYGPLRCEINIGMCYSLEEQRKIVEKWAFDIINDLNYHS